MPKITKRQIFESEKLSVDSTCNVYEGNDEIANFSLWKFIRESPRTRAECRKFLESIGVSKNISQRTSSAINWLRSRGFIKTNRDSVAEDLKEQKPATIMTMPEPQQQQAEPFNMTPREFIEHLLKRHPEYKETSILVVARHSQRVKWDKVREVIHLEMPHLCSCRD